MTKSIDPYEKVDTVGRKLEKYKNKVVQQLKEQGQEFDQGWTEYQCSLILSRIPCDGVKDLKYLADQKWRAYSEAWLVALDKEIMNRALEHELGIPCISFSNRKNRCKFG